MCHPPPPPLLFILFFLLNSALFFFLLLIIRWIVVLQVPPPPQVFLGPWVSERECVFFRGSLATTSESLKRVALKVKNGRRFKEGKKKRKDSKSFDAQFRRNLLAHCCQTSLETIFRLDESLAKKN